ncbi:Ubiquitin domain-containing protein ubfd1 [Homalodisca vitripennis]|nr:Ubiquitin domain-containing protein ubfd1 [Homalodisca vitripennis]
MTHTGGCGCRQMGINSVNAPIAGLSAVMDVADEKTNTSSTKEPFCKQKMHRKVLDKGVPDDVMPGIKDTKEALPPFPLVGMLNKSGGKVRLTFKLELDQVWIGTKERTDKIPMNSIKSIVSEPIEGHEQYHVMCHSDRAATPTRLLSEASATYFPKDPCINLHFHTRAAADGSIPVTVSSMSIPRQDIVLALLLIQELMNADSAERHKNQWNTFMAKLFCQLQKQKKIIVAYLLSPKNIREQEPSNLIDFYKSLEV